MHLTTATLLALSAFATALPTVPILEPIDTSKIHVARDARAATIYKSANAVGESTFIPANNYCTNIAVVPGGFDGKIQSLSVEKGRKCDFYQ